ncbi:hypothetical protein D3C86_2105530 [compost metagenome]
MHDLHKLQGGGVANVLGFGKGIMHGTDCAGACLPEVVQNFQFRVGGLDIHTVI